MERQPFNLWVPLDMEKSVEAGGERRICGIISTEDADLDGEKILEQYSNYAPMIEQMGKNLSAALTDHIDWNRFSERHGWIKWEHGDEPGNIIGIPDRIEKGIAYRDPINGAMKSGTAIYARLFGPDAGVAKANEAWALIQAIRKSGFDRKLGYSIEGAYLPLPDLPPSAKACMVTNTVLTTKPVQSFAWCDLAKALVAGPGNTDSNLMQGGEALRKQSLHPTPLARIQGGKKKKCEHCDDDLDAKKALEHLVCCDGLPVDRATKAVIRIFKLVA